MVHDHLGINYLKRHHKKDQATRDLPPVAIICIYELSLLGMEVVVSCTRYMVLYNEMKGPAKLPETICVSIHEAKVTSLVWIDGVELHVVGLGEGGRFMAQKLPREGTDLVKRNMVV